MSLVRHAVRCLRPSFYLTYKENALQNKLFKLQFKKARFPTPVQIQRVYIKLPRNDSNFKNMRNSVFFQS